MGTKPAVRFITTINGVSVELARVRERTNGQLNINVRGQPIALIDGEPRVVKEQHYSVHDSNDGKDTSITFKQTFEKGPSIELVSMVHDTREHLLWPVVAKRIGISNSLEQRQPNVREKDFTYALAGSNSENSTLFYTIMTTNSEFKVSEHPQITLLSHEFLKFKVIVAASYLNIPSLPIGDIAAYSTSFPTFDRNKLEDHPQAIRNAFPPEELHNVHWLMLDILKANMMARLGDVISAMSARERGTFSRMSAAFTRRPCAEFVLPPL